MDSLLDMLPQMMNLAERRRASDVAEQRVKQDQQEFLHQKTKDELTQFNKLLDHPLVKATPALQDQIFAQIGERTGIPKEFLTPEVFQRSREQIGEVMRGVTSMDTNRSNSAIADLFILSGPDDARKFMESVKDVPVLHEKMRALQAKSALEEERVTSMRNTNMQIGIMKMPYQMASQDFGMILDRTNTRDFQDAMRFASSPLAKNRPQMAATKSLYGNGEAKAFFNGDIAKQGAEWVKTAESLTNGPGSIEELQTILGAHGRGGDLPDGKSKNEIEYELMMKKDLARAYQTMGEWAQDSMNPEKYKAAKSASKAMEKQRMAIATMEGSLKRDTQSFREEALDAKHLAEMRKSDAINAFLSLPDAEKTEQRAASIAQQLGVSAGDLLAARHNKSAVTVENKIDVKTGESIGKKVGDIVEATRDQAIGAVQQIEIAYRIEDALNAGKVTLGPGATARQFMQQLAVNMGFGDSDIAEQLARTRDVIKGLAELTLAARKQLKGQGSVSDYEGKLLARASSGEITDFTEKEIRTITEVTERLARTQYGLHEHQLNVMRKEPSERALVPHFEVPGLPEARKRGRSQSEKSSAPSNFQSHYDSLPSGATYQDPHGVWRKKK